MRRIKVYKWSGTAHNPCKDRVFDYVGTFHGWGMDFMEFAEDPAVNFTVAIVEDDGGRVHSVPVDLVKFVFPTKPEEVTQ